MMHQPLIINSRGKTLLSVNPNFSSIFTIQYLKELRMISNSKKYLYCYICFYETTYFNKFKR